MRASKWHVLSHVVRTIRQAGSIKYIHAGTFENSHKLSKNHSMPTSKKQRTAMDETLARMSIEVMSANIARQKFLMKMEKKSSIDCVAQNETVLVTAYMAATFLQLGNGEQFLLEKKLNLLMGPVVIDFVLNLTKYLHKKGLRSLVSLIQEKFFAGVTREA